MIKLSSSFLALSLSFCSTAFAESILHQAGKSVGEFTSSVGSSVTDNMRKTMQANELQWITIEPKSKETCLKESGGTLDHTYMRCRNGRQEYVRFDANGQKVVLSERAIPAYR
jgi:hypothetical protein